MEGGFNGLAEKTIAEPTPEMKLGAAAVLPLGSGEKR